MSYPKQVTLTECGRDGHMEIRVERGGKHNNTCHLWLDHLKKRNLALYKCEYKCEYYKVHKGKEPEVKKLLDYLGIKKNIYPPKPPKKAKTATEPKQKNTTTPTVKNTNGTITRQDKLEEVRQECRKECQECRKVRQECRKECQEKLEEYDKKLEEVRQECRKECQEKLEEYDKKLEEVRHKDEKVEKVETERRRSTRIKKNKVCEVVKEMNESKSQKYKNITHDMCTHIPYDLKDRWLDFTPTGILKKYEDKRLCKTSDFINPIKCKKAPIELHIYMYPIFEKIGLIH